MRRFVIIGSAVIIGLIAIVTGVILIPVLEEYRCEVSGGHWGRLSLSPQEYCNPATSDAGKECTDESECQGYCEAKRDAVIGSEDVGMCSEFKSYSGCTTAILNGIVLSWCE